jgi:hypothetical protein
MEIKAALLCDWATVREGLLHVLGGGITRIWRPDLPARLGVSLALLVDVPPDGQDMPHEIHTKINGDDGTLFGQVMAALQVVPGPRMETGEHILLPLVIPLQEVLVPRHGRYDFHISVDQEEPAGLQCWVLHPEEQILPPFGPGT